jgi:hypothetical protein
VSESTNSFYCFGPCSAQGSVIDFISLVEGTPLTIAVVKLAKRIGIMDKNGDWDEIQLDAYNFNSSDYEEKKTIEPYLFKMSELFFKYIKKHSGSMEDNVKEMEKVFYKVDCIVNKLEYNDWESAEKLYGKVKRKIKIMFQRN